MQNFERCSILFLLALVLLQKVNMLVHKLQSATSMSLTHTISAFNVMIQNVKLYHKLS